MSEYIPEAIALGLGLDVASPKIGATKGSLQSCLNYDITDTIGMSRIDGYERYDGRISGANDAFYVIEFEETTPLSYGTLLGIRDYTYASNTTQNFFIATESSGNILEVEPVDSLFEYKDAIDVSYPPGTITSADVTIVAKVLTSLDTSKFIISATNYDLINIGGSLVDLSSSSTTLTVKNIISYVDWHKAFWNDAEKFYTDYRSLTSDLRDPVKPLPGVAGLHWFRDTLYAVAAKSSNPNEGTLWKAQTEQQAADLGLGTVDPALVGWQEIDIGTASLPLIPSLEEANSRYEFVSHNFKGGEQYDAFFGVNGVGQAFTYDGTTFSIIKAMPDLIDGEGQPYPDPLDKPRHIGVFNFRLMLAYQQGSVLYSVAGDPTNFDPLLFAGEIAVGDRITGVQRLVGDYFGIFCAGSIWGYQGDPGSGTDTLVNISSNIGCLEYSLANSGSPVFCNSSGIVSLETTAAYGDFIGQPISYKISPLIRPRMKRVTGKQGLATAFLGVMMVRAKNQYRFFFKDGLTITMTRVGQGEAEFTTQRYGVVPYCWSSDYDSTGEERIHFADLDQKVGVSSGLVYELERGWGFDGSAFPSFFELNPMTGPSPVMFYSIMKARVHGLSKGLATLKLQVSGNQNDFGNEYNNEVEDMSMPRNFVYYDPRFRPTTNICSLADRGLMVKLKVSSNNATTTEPPHICQAFIILNRASGKVDV